MSGNTSKQELIDLVECIVTIRDKQTGRKFTEDEHFKLVVKFTKSVNHPGGSDLIYYPEAVGLPRNATIEQIAT